MNDDTKPARRLMTRREALAMTAGLGAAALGIAPAGAATASAKALLTRPIPRTGERLAVVGLGTAVVFDIGDDAAQRAERRAVIETLLAGGARLIDTAPSYGAAESVVGDLLAGLKVRDKIFLATKVRAASRDRAIAEMQQSQRRLRTETIDLMQIHNVGFVDRNEIAAQLALLREWKERAVFRYIGVTHSQSQDRANDRLIEIMRTEKLDFIQVNYSMAERSVEQRLLPTAAATGTAVRQPAVRPRPAVSRRARQAGAGVGRGIRGDDLGPVLPQVPPRERGADLRDTRHGQAGVRGGQPRRRTRPAAERCATQADGGIYRPSALTPQLAGLCSQCAV
jgi:hypothetical protein